MNVLDAFLHDPLVEWEDEKRKLVSGSLSCLFPYSNRFLAFQEREPTKRNQVKPSVDLDMLAHNALNPIEKKLNGVHMMNKERLEKEVSTSTLVQILIQEATDKPNLVSILISECQLY
jgi:serine/threonine-protein kinase ATR